MLLQVITIIQHKCALLHENSLYNGAHITFYNHTLRGNKINALLNEFKSISCVHADYKLFKADHFRH